MFATKSRQTLEPIIWMEANNVNKQQHNKINKATEWLRDTLWEILIQFWVGSGVRGWAWDVRDSFKYIKTLLCDERCAIRSLCIIWSRLTLFVSTGFLFFSSPKSSINYEIVIFVIFIVVESIRSLAGCEFNEPVPAFIYSLSLRYVAVSCQVWNDDDWWKLID